MKLPKFKQFDLLSKKLFSIVFIIWKSDDILNP
jgi:hypothetical protein